MKGHTGVFNKIDQWEGVEREAEKAHGHRSLMVEPEKPQTR